MSYEIKIEKKALKFIERQLQNKREMLLKAISRLPDGDTKRMKGCEFLYRGARFAARAGNLDAG